MDFSIKQALAVVVVLVAAVIVVATAMTMTKTNNDNAEKQNNKMWDQVENQVNNMNGTLGTD